MARPRNEARDKARKAGARHFHGKPCGEGHTLRHVISGACVECQAEAQRQRRAKRAGLEIPSPELGDMFG